MGWAFARVMHLGNPERRVNQSDEYFLDLVLQGEKDCFGELIERWQRKIYRFIMSVRRECCRRTRSDPGYVHQGLPESEPFVRFLAILSLAVQDSARRVPDADASGGPSKARILA